MKCLIFAIITAIVALVLLSGVPGDWLYLHTQCDVVGHKTNSTITVDYGDRQTVRQLPDETGYQCGDVVRWEAL